MMTTKKTVADDDKIPLPMAETRRQLWAAEEEVLRLRRAVADESHRKGLADWERDHLPAERWTYAEVPEGHELHAGGNYVVRDHDGQIMAHVWSVELARILAAAPELQTLIRQYQIALEGLVTWAGPTETYFEQPAKEGQ